MLVREDRTHSDLTGAVNRRHDDTQAVANLHGALLIKSDLGSQHHAEDMSRIQRINSQNLSKLVLEYHKTEKW